MVKLVNHHYHIHKFQLQSLNYHVYKFQLHLLNFVSQYWSLVDRGMHLFFYLFVSILSLSASLIFRSLLLSIFSLFVSLKFLIIIETYTVFSLCLIRTVLLSNI